jgi:hypothetical protein
VVAALAAQPPADAASNYCRNGRGVIISRFFVLAYQLLPFVLQGLFWLRSAETGDCKQAGTWPQRAYKAYLYK